MTSVATGIGPATRNETVVLSTKISDVYHAPTKKKAPAMPRPFLYFVRIRPDRHRYRCRRRPSISRTNPWDVSLMHCPRRAVNQSYTLMDMVKRVLTMFISTRLAAFGRSGGSAVGRGGETGREFGK